MDIEFKTKKLKSECLEYVVAKKVYGYKMAEKIAQRIGELRMADTVEMLVQFSIGRCHPLKGNRKGEYAMDLVHPYRLVFIKMGDEIQIARIVSIEDYHN